MLALLYFYDIIIFMTPVSPEITLSPTRPEGQAGLDQSLEFLQALHSKSKTLSCRMAVDSAVFAGEVVSVLPYYMNRFDPVENGYWKIEVSGHPDTRVRTMADDIKGASYDFSIRAEAGEFREATDVESQSYGALLDVLGSNYSDALRQSGNTRETGERGHHFSTMGSLSLKRFSKRS
jgi:hypothetical protein